MIGSGNLDFLISLHHDQLSLIHTSHTHTATGGKTCLQETPSVSVLHTEIQKNIERGQRIIPTQILVRGGYHSSYFYHKTKTS
jgi:hypothetical protein